MHTETIMPTAGLKEKILIQAQIECLTGLAIGGSNDMLDIGGISKSIIRNPADGRPYIPGSSIKGKMRSLLEQLYGYLGSKYGIVDYGPSMDPRNPGAALFGTIQGKDKKDKKENQGKPENGSPKIVQIPSAVIVRDAFLDETATKARFGPDAGVYTEVKTEVMICRVTAKAMPRTSERISAGAVFTFSMLLNVSRETTGVTGRDNRDQLLTWLCQALHLLQDDYIGGGGSRGNGQVAIRITGAEVRDMDFYTGVTSQGVSILPQVQALFEKTPHSTPTAP